MNDLNPARLSELRALLLSILLRRSRLIGGRAMFTTMGYTLGNPDVRQGEVRFYITPDPHAQSMPILTRIVNDRLPSGSLQRQEIVTPAGMVTKTWISVTEERLRKMTYQITPWAPLGILALLLLSCYVWMQVFEIRDRVIL